MIHLVRDHIDGLLTAELIVRTPAVPDAERITREIVRLDGMIDATPCGPRHTDLCAAFRALNWARSPDAFTPPSECVLPGVD